jgi:hypothetical protein
MFNPSYFNPPTFTPFPFHYQDPTEQKKKDPSEQKKNDIPFFSSQPQLIFNEILNVSLKMMDSNKKKPLKKQSQSVP